jgi:hypothetical protein
MSPRKSIEADRRDAKGELAPQERVPDDALIALSSPGPLAPQPTAAVNPNDTRGLRARNTHLTSEPSDGESIHQALLQEWQPATRTEAALVEQMAVAEARLIRLESQLTRVCHESEFCNALSPTEEDERLSGLLLNRELKIQRLIGGLSQNIARIERSWHKSLDILLKLQDRRHKQEAAQIRESDAKNVKKGPKRGDQIPSDEVNPGYIPPFASVPHPPDSPTQPPEAACRALHGNGRSVTLSSDAPRHRPGGIGQDFPGDGKTSRRARPQ